MEARNLNQIKKELTSGLLRMNSGKLVKLTEMKPDDILIQDIAHHLAMKVRWNGAVNKFYSVAEHCIHVASFVPLELKLEALLHDAPEAYLFDIPRPLYNMFPFLVALEDTLHFVCAEKFGLHMPYHEKVRSADDYILMEERYFLIERNVFNSMSPDEAKDKFMQKYHEYLPYHKPVDWTQDHVDELKIKLAEREWMQRLADEIEPDLRKAAMEDSKQQCKACGAFFDDEESLFDHYDTIHNKGEHHG